MTTIYLAGPDVFLASAIEMGLTKKNSARTMALKGCSRWMLNSRKSARVICRPEFLTRI